MLPYLPRHGAMQWYIAVNGLQGGRQQNQCSRAVMAREKGAARNRGSQSQNCSGQRLAWPGGAWLGGGTSGGYPSATAHLPLNMEWRRENVQIVAGTWNPPEIATVSQFQKTERCSFNKTINSSGIQRFQVDSELIPECPWRGHSRTASHSCLGPKLGPQGEKHWGGGIFMTVQLIKKPFADYIQQTHM